MYVDLIYKFISIYVFKVFFINLGFFFAEKYLIEYTSKNYNINNLFTWLLSQHFYFLNFYFFNFVVLLNFFFSF